jgi:hypothetical protein
MWDAKDVLGTIKRFQVILRPRPSVTQSVVPSSRHDVWAGSDFDLDHDKDS